MLWRTSFGTEQLKCGRQINRKTLQINKTVQYQLNLLSLKWQNPMMLIKLTKLKKVMLLNENYSSNFHKKRKKIGLRYHFWKKNLQSLPHYRGIHVKFTFKKFSMRKWRGTCFFMNMLLQRLSAGLTMTIVPIFARYQSFNKVFEPN